jgi:DnaK suppressor protein
MPSKTKRSAAKPAGQAQEFLAEADISQLKDLLLHKRHELTGDVDNLRQDAVAGSDSANWEEDGTDAFDREFAFLMAESRNEIINQIDESLARIEERTYGVCETCREKIGRARMKALPFCKTCIACQAQSETGRPSRARMPG